ncbi:MAG: mandelate racemase/muconate lactonizing enzyme family protein [SAR202 cluster bacterium]|jgi:galactonate dehydratase|nr:MAG: mandelate racemase/muconate lactonizing enzyme family protein [SAR202 cluster bacterium]KAA1299185.1 MAG: mandelate racemase/muconate lactonizing enzyme family protein [SAR202 cluster bacterium]MQG91037.1 mandelate racemase/muconate lactonizing enzyme family protein [SAR202 cluster bacterium]GIT19615.1 MAG: D-galactonate dehydratase [Dehalococcoidia bacterium]
MKITDIKPFPVWVGTRNQMLVKVETDEGIYGWGESGLSSREIAVKGMVEHYREFLIGRDPMQRGSLWQEMYRSQYFEGGRTMTAAISAIDIALYDIVGKKLNVPVYELLGGKHRDWVPTFASGTGSSPEEMIEVAQQIIAQGFDCFRLHHSYGREEGENIFEPREAIAETAEGLIKAREVLGPRPVIGNDFHHRLSVAEAISFCQMMPAHTLDFLEEPIRDETPEAYETLRKMTPMPFALGEEFASKWQFLPYIERGLANYIRVDICNVGGITEAMKVAGWAEAHYIDLMPHNPLGPICVAATAHLAMAAANFSWLEIRESAGESTGFYSKEVFPVQPEVTPGRVTVLDRPGLGVEVDEESLTEPFRHSEMPHLKRNDGSHTNW